MDQPGSEPGWPGLTVKLPQRVGGRVATSRQGDSAGVPCSGALCDGRGASHVFSRQTEEFLLGLFLSLGAGLGASQSSLISSIG